MRPQLFVYDDPVARGWEPFAATRPAGELLFGSMLLRERIERVSGLGVAAYIAGESLRGWEEHGAPPVVTTSELPEYGPAVVVSSRYIPQLGRSIGLYDALAKSAKNQVVRLTVQGETVGWILPADRAFRAPLDESTIDPGRRLSEGSPWEPAETVEADGTVAGAPWDLIERNAEQLRDDLSTIFDPASDARIRFLEEAEGVIRLGTSAVTCEDDVKVDPGAVLDTRNGPIHLSSGVRIRPFTHLRGPAYIGRGSTLLGGLIEAVTCGPVCKLRGEIDASVILGYANKAHDGYLGHALIGRWVNLGAFTTNSDLKNNYGAVRVESSEGEIATGLLKLGVFLGDHVKTGIGTLLGAGTTIGTGTNLFGPGIPPKRVPAFGWGNSGHLTIHRKKAFLETAARAMARRDVALTPGLESFLSSVWDRTHAGDGDDEPTG